MNGKDYRETPSLEELAAQRKALRKRSWVYYVLPLPLENSKRYRPGRVFVEFEASCRSCGSGQIMFRDKETP